MKNLADAEGAADDAPLWRPCATLDALRELARLRAAIRAWMDARGLLEVATPVLSLAAPSDPGLDAFRTVPDAPGADGRARFLQTSPEYPMKRLLAAYGVDLYQICPVFRAGERGARHNPEFTMLEWYRVGLDHRALMDETAALLEGLWRGAGRPWHPPERRACADLVDAALGGSSVAAHGELPEATVVRERFVRLGRPWPETIGADADAALDLLFDELVLPTLPTDRATFVDGWFAARAALARLGEDRRGRAVAERFELYVGSLEIGNGYHELADAREQRARFEADLARRRARGQETPPVDERLVDALAAGLPDCAGIAIGLERLAMALYGASSIDALLAFPFERA